MTGKPPESGIARVHVKLVSDGQEGVEHTVETDSFKSPFIRGEVTVLTIDDSAVSYWCTCNRTVRSKYS